MPRKKILVVDDELQILNLLDIELTAAGYEVIKAENAAKAFGKAKSDVPALILMDIMLPDMNGAEVIRKLKSQPETKNIPVIFLTGMVTKKEEKKALADVNVDGKLYKAIAKPFNPAELLKEVKKA
jgi:CheY-like chemotaxis protein